MKSILRFLLAWLVLPIALCFTVVVAVILMLILPFYVALHPETGKPWNFILAGVIALLMIANCASDACRAFRLYYGSESMTAKVRIRIRNPILYTTFSYIYFLLTFASFYAYVSREWPKTFNGPLSAMDAIYFSVMTSATVGYGDIVPRSDLSKSLVVAQTLLSLAFVILLFSVASSYLREQIPTDKLPPENV